MAKYIKKSFAPHIYQDWIHLFKQCSTEQRSELLLAITDYPNYEPIMDIAIWDFIKSQLDVQYQKTENKSQTMSDNRNKSRPKSTEVDQSRPITTEVDQSRPKSTEVDKSSQIEIEIKKEIENKEKEISVDISKKTSEFTMFHVECQNFDEIPPHILPIMKRYWTDEKIEKIRKDLAFMPSHDTNVSLLLTQYDYDKDLPPKPKTTRFVKPTLEEVKTYCRERMNMVDAEKFMNYYESNGWKVGKNPMKDWKAAIRTWEKSTTTQQQQAVLRLSSRERQDMINKQKTEALLKTLEEKGF